MLPYMARRRCKTIEPGQRYCDLDCDADRRWEAVGITSALAGVGWVNPGESRGQTQQTCRLGRWVSPGFSPGSTRPAAGAMAHHMDRIFLALWWMIPTASVSVLILPTVAFGVRWIRVALVLSLGAVPLFLLLCLALAVASAVVIFWIGPFYLLSGALAVVMCGDGVRAPLSRRGIAGWLLPMSLLHLTGAYWVYWAVRLPL
jgi:hypothetical protein